MTYTTSLIENTAATTFATQLEADLATGVRGGNKYRLLARIWWHKEGANNDMAYRVWRTFNAKRTFAQIHADYDQFLPAKWRADKGSKEVAPGASAKELTKKAQKLAKSFERTSDLTAEQRQWVIEQGGVEALDGRKVRVANGRVFAFLDGSWYGTAQTIQGCIDGTKELV